MVFASSFKGATGPGEPCSPQKNPKEQKCQIQSSTRKHLSLVTASRSICKAVDLLFTYSPQLPPSTYCSCHGQQQDTGNWLMLQLLELTSTRSPQASSQQHPQASSVALERSLGIFSAGLSRTSPSRAKNTSESRPAELREAAMNLEKLWCADAKCLGGIFPWEKKHEGSPGLARCGCKSKARTASEHPNPHQNN